MYTEQPNQHQAMQGGYPPSPQHEALRQQQEMDQNILRQGGHMPTSPLPGLLDAALARHRVRVPAEVERAKKLREDAMNHCSEIIDKLWDTPAEEPQETEGDAMMKFFKG